MDDLFGVTKLVEKKVENDLDEKRVETRTENIDDRV